MSKTSDYSVAIAAAAAFLFLHYYCAAAHTVHVVGDNTGWRVPSPMDFYSTWASNKTFALNDVLRFDFTTNAHDVVKVPQASYGSCSSDNKIGEIINTGPATVTLNETGTHYFICTIGQHCVGGQKLAVNVVSAAGGPSPSSSPSPSSTPQTPPPPSSAPPPALAGCFLIMLSFALGKLVL